MAYGVDTPPQLQIRVPLLTLVARNRSPLKEAFEHFAQWAATSDGDAVDLTILIRGGDALYDFALSPEASRLRQRCMGFDRVFEPILNLVSWIKPDLPISPHMRQFQQYAKRLFSPFVFNGASYSGLATVSPDFASVRPLDDACKLLKFSATVVDESDVQQGTFAHRLLQLRRRPPTSKYRRPSRKDIRGMDLAAAFERRERALNYHFPVTRARLDSRPQLKALKAECSSFGLHAWQIDQAVCNLVLSIAMTGERFFTAIPAERFIDDVAQALNKRFEQADGNTSQLDALDKSWILEQARLDAIALLGEAGQRSEGLSLPELLERMDRLALRAPLRVEQWLN